MTTPDHSIASNLALQRSHPSVSYDLDRLCARIGQHRAEATDPRVIIGLVGEPGAGKSTLGGELVTALKGSAILVPMDGFHLSNQVLDQLGRRDRKGAPDTFDAHGFAHLVSRLRDRTEDVVYAPEFVRGLDEPVAGAIAVHRSTPIVILEGNYLLLDKAPWREVAQYLDAVWFVDLDSSVRLQRLAERHRSFGRTHAEAKSWAATQDEANASLIRRTRQRADLIISMPG